MPFTVIDQGDLPDEPLSPEVAAKIAVDTAITQHQLVQWGNAVNEAGKKPKPKKSAGTQAVAMPPKVVIPEMEELDILQAVINAGNSIEAAYGILFADEIDEIDEFAEPEEAGEFLLTEGAYSPFPHLIYYDVDHRPVLSDENTMIFYLPMDFPILPGGRYGHGTMNIPCSLLGTCSVIYREPEFVTVDVFVPSHQYSPYGEDSWQTIHLAAPTIQVFQGSGNVSQHIGLSIAEERWGENGKARLVMPASFSEDGIRLWDRSSFVHWQSWNYAAATVLGLSPDQSINPGNFDVGPSSSIGWSAVALTPQVHVFDKPRDNTNIPSPLAEFPLKPTNAPASFATGVAIAADYLGTILAGPIASRAQSKRDDQVEDFLPFGDNLVMGMEIQRMTEGDEEELRAILYGWQYFTVAESNLSDPESFSSNRMMQMAVGSYIGSQGLFPIIVSDLTGEDSWRDEFGGWQNTQDVPFSYWNQR